MKSSIKYLKHVQKSCLFQACITQVYHLKVFNTANTITMKKPGKKVTDYATPKGSCPIALLNTLDKVMESIIEKKILIYVRWGSWSTAWSKKAK